MSIRAIFIISAKIDTEVPVFVRHFPTVEARCKSRLGQLYVKIPPERDFVKMLFTEVGLRGGDTFMEVRDHCDKEFSNPAFQIKTDSGILWPVVVIERQHFMYCAITFEEKLKTSRQSSSMKLALMASVAMCLEVLTALAHYVESHSLLQGSSGKIELLNFISAAFPFGRPICCSSQVAQNFPSSTWKGKVKQPAWNLVQFKGKSYITLHIREEVRCIQFNQSGVTNPVDVYGVVMCSSEVEGVAPEISLVLSNMLESRCGLLVNTCVSNIENITPSSTRLRFHPVKAQTLCMYKISGSVPPPIEVTFSIKFKGDAAIISVLIKLKSSVKNSFQKLEVHIPLACAVSSVRSNCSQGSLIVNSQNILIWNVGSKLPSKSLEASLKARAKLKHKKGDTELLSTGYGTGHLQEGVSKMTLSDSFPALENESASYALINFTIADYVYSGTKIDSQCVVASIGSKLNRSVTSECCSGLYKVYSSENNEESVNDTLLEELKTIIQAS